MSAGRICSCVLATAVGHEDVRAAARRMAEHGVGTLVVTEPDGVSRALGIVTDRDIVTRTVAVGLDPEKTPVSKVMSSPVQSVHEHTPIEEALAKMVTAGTRRVVVTGERGRLVGVLSVDDVLGLLGEEASAIGRLLEKQTSRIGVGAEVH